MVQDKIRCNIHIPGLWMPKDVAWQGMATHDRSRDLRSSSLSLPSIGRSGEEYQIPSHWKQTNLERNLNSLDVPWHRPPFSSEIRCGKLQRWLFDTFFGETAAVNLLNVGFYHCLTGLLRILIFNGSVRIVIYKNVEIYYAYYTIINVN